MFEAEDVFCICPESGNKQSQYHRACCPVFIVSAYLVGIQVMSDKRNGDLLI